ncbi:DNA helicase I [Shewanella psychropiezotolerans]|uniref:DNA helicase I n=1 Tax=Shewanella psychropiezotolerans TaxID=2593655 RepID=A0ABX5WYG1_9GAMM|nr:DEAD/DEAH box helicase [Shewanella psychropiezotolerans]QDO84134.1 DNA helicase I [Shewanella psychropiezotolerans]
MEVNNKLALKILDYWHKIEFFNSADMGDIAKRGNGAIHYDTQQVWDTPDCLPWINRNHIRRAGEKYKHTEHYTYKVYLGLFWRTEIFEAGKQYLPNYEDQSLDGNERNQDSGFTCSVILHIDQYGNIDLDKTEISTAPWAIGKTQNKQLHELKFEHFDNEGNALCDKFNEVCVVANNIKEEHGYPKVLTTYELIEFTRLIAEWAKFEPISGKPIPFMLIELQPKKYKQQEYSPQIRDFNDLPLPDLSDLNQRIEQYYSQASNASSAIDNDQNNAKESKSSISILNSFYIRDIELVIEQLRKGKIDPHSALASYVGHTPQRESDLLSKKGQSLIRKHLSLNMTPLGRWPGEDEHSMSMMQQFAINTLYKELEEQGVYSVNGPPGTGKTTMLRDIIANNLVNRARSISVLSSIADSSPESIKVDIGDESVTLPVLCPTLTGYEMVVVSSNNTAVENITKELPQSKALGKRYQAVEFFKSAAQKLAANHIYPKNNHGRTKLKCLEHNEECWGVMAAAIGNQSNRKVVGDRLFFLKPQSLDVEAGAEGYQTLFDSIKDQASKTSNIYEAFTRAQYAFKQSEQELESCLSELRALQLIESKKCHLRDYESKFARVEYRCLKLDILVGRLKKKQLSHLLFFLPKFWFQRQLFFKMKQRFELLGKENMLIGRKVANFKCELEKEIQRCSEFQVKYTDVRFDDGQADLECASLQRSAFAHGLELNQKRANVTSKAIALHQAWVVTAYKHFNLGYKSVLFYLHKAMSNSIKDPKASKVLWQWLFMFIPVVSSTFASVSRQFSMFGKGDIGWLFIDEAGQASPQQAVGALYRSKRVVVVGDPLQIEPVFTIPPEFVEGLAKEILGEEQWRVWSPTKTSVQKLADRINRYGTEMIAKGEWLGSPLRVHRRCDEPMFSIANKIAYNEKMFHGSDSPEGCAHNIWGHSTWIDISGEVEGKHYVPTQGKHIAKMVLMYFRELHTLPDVYIISPFRKVAYGVQEELLSYLGNQGIPSIELKKWITGRIGTVHTFQGKEEKVVIFVLGVSDETKGSAYWASSKANILNVAVTRAKKQVYIVGSKKVWAGLSFFYEANNLLSSENERQNSLNLRIA